MTMHEAEELWRRSSDKPGPPDPEVIRRVRSDARTFSRRILFRDIREWAASLLLSTVFVGVALQPGSPRTAFFLAAVCALIPALWMVIDRFRSGVPRPDLAAPCRDQVSFALSAISHQEHLLRTLFWWYLGPLGASALLVTWAVSVDAPGLPFGARILTALLMLAICGGVFYVVWKINQMAIHKSLEPRRHELQALLTELREETLRI